MNKKQAPLDNALQGMPKRPAFYMPMASLMRWGILVLLVLISIGIWACMMLIGEREMVIRSEVQRRVELQAAAKAEVLSTWVDGLKVVGDHIVNSELIRLYTSESSLAEGQENGGVDESLAAQLPYMQQVMVDYAAQNDLNGAFILSRSGKVLMNSRVAEAFSDAVAQSIESVFMHGRATVAPLQNEGFGLIFTVIKPIFDMDGTDTVVSGVLLSEFIVDKKLPDFMAVSPVAEEGERANLLQSNGIDLEVISLDGVTALRVIPEGRIAASLIGERSLRDFRVDESPKDGSRVYLAAALVENAPFIVAYEFNADKALAPLRGFRNVVQILTLMVVALISVLIISMVSHLLATRNRQRVRMQEKSMMALVKAVEIRDPYLSGHHERLARMAVRLGNEMGLSIPERSTLFYAGLLSGVGKIFIPQEVLNKKTKLTPKEQKQIQEHIPHAERVLEDIDFDFPVLAVIRQMYERMDGSGYPASEKGESINLLARVLGACDVYCALTRPRIYRKALSPKDAIAEMRKEASKFDADVLDVLENIATQEQKRT